MGKSGLFCIASPLQAICAVEAMCEYEIEEKKVIVISDSFRTNQIESYLEKECIPFSIEKYKGGFFYSFLEFISSVNPFVGKYDYLFLGNYLSFSLKMILLPYIHNHGKIVYLDDGSSTVSIANGSLKYTFPMQVRSKWCDIIVYARSISDNNFFSIFSDDIKKDGWTIKKNTLSNILNKRKDFRENTNRYVLVIGTATDVFCDYLGIDIKDFLLKLKALFIDIKERYNGYRIVYIPHGRDRRTDIKELCADEGVEYRASNECVEIYAINDDSKPVCVLAFTSTALKTLNIIYPEIPVYNLLIVEGRNKKHIDEYINLSDNYEKSGIVKIIL